MPESKSGALTNLATPLHGIAACRFTVKQPTHKLHLLPTNKRMGLQITALADNKTIWMVKRLNLLR